MKTKQILLKLSFYLFISVAIILFVAFYEVLNTIINNELYLQRIGAISVLSALIFTFVRIGKED